jgi:hypothetical protein
LARVVVIVVFGGGGGGGGSCGDGAAAVFVFVDSGKMDSTKMNSVAVD